MRRRLAPTLIAMYLTLILPSVAFAATSTPEKPEGHDWTLDSIFIVALIIPVVLAVLTLIDIAVGKHSGKHH